MPTFWVIEAELGGSPSGCSTPGPPRSLPQGSEEALLLGAFLRQAVLSLLQDQATIHSLLQQALANEDVDQLAAALDNLRALLLSHQRQLMGDLVGLFSPDLRQKLFPDSPSLTEEGDRLRQRLYRLWQYLDPVLAKVQVQLELRSWPRLALALAQAQGQVVTFRRSPEFILIRSLDRKEFERLTQQLVRALDEPEEIEPALAQGAEIAGELLRFLDVFLLRINARVPLIRLDLNTSREAHRLAAELAALKSRARPSASGSPTSSSRPPRPWRCATRSRSTCSSAGSGPNGAAGTSTAPWTPSARHLEHLCLPPGHGHELGSSHVEHPLDRHPPQRTGPGACGRPWPDGGSRSRTGSGEGTLLIVADRPGPPLDPSRGHRDPVVGGRTPTRRAPARCCPAAPAGWCARTSPWRPCATAWSTSRPGTWAARAGCGRCCTWPPWTSCCGPS